MGVSKEVLLEKINLVVDKLMNLDSDKPVLEENLTVEQRIAKGLAKRDFGIQEWDWPQGVGLYGLSKLEDYYGDGRYKEFFNNWFKSNVEKGLPSKNINTTAPYLTLADKFAELENAKLYEEMCMDRVDWLLNELPKTKEGGFQHVTSDIEDANGIMLNDGQLWIDTLFMTVLFLNKMGHKYGKTEWTQEAIRQVLVHIKYLYDKQTGLFHHGWSFVENGNFGGVFWCRGNSWFTFGIMDFIEECKGTLGTGLETYLIDTYKAQVDALVNLQAPSGLWRTVLTDETSYEEVSGSAAILTGILKGIHGGILDSGYQECADKAIQAICDNVNEDGTVLNVSSGTAVGYNAQHYKNIIIAPMAYGQSLALVALCEALKG